MWLHRKWLVHEYYSWTLIWCPACRVIYFNWNPLLLRTHIQFHCVYIFARWNGKIKSKPRYGITPRYSQKQHRIKGEFVCEHFSKTEKVQQYLLKQNNVNPCSIKFLFEGNYFWNTGRGWRKGGQLTKQEGPWSNWLPPPPQHTSRDRLSLWRTHKLTSAQCEEMYKYCGVFSYLQQYSTDSAIHFYTEQTNSIAVCASINNPSL